MGHTPCYIISLPFAQLYAEILRVCDVLIVGMQIVHATIAAHDKDGDGRLSRTEFRSLLAASQEEHQSLSVKVA